MQPNTIIGNNLLQVLYTLSYLSTRPKGLILLVGSRGSLKRIKMSASLRCLRCRVEFPIHVGLQQKVVNIIQIVRWGYSN